MKVGDLVKFFNGCVGIITCVDPEGIGDTEEVEVVWTDAEGTICNHSAHFLEVISESR